MSTRLCESNVSDVNTQDAERVRLPGLLSNWTTSPHLSTASASVFVDSLHSNTIRLLSRFFLDGNCNTDPVPEVKAGHTLSFGCIISKNQ